MSTLSKLRASLVATVLLGGLMAPAHAAPAPEDTSATSAVRTGATAERGGPRTGSQCDYETFKPRIESASKPKSVVKFHGISTFSVAGTKTFKKRTAFVTRSAVSLSASMRVNGGIRTTSNAGASGIFKLAVKASVQNDISLRGKLEGALSYSKSKQKYVYVERGEKFSGYRTIVVYDGALKVTGTAVYLFCRPEEGRHYGYIVRDNLSFTIAGVPGHGEQACDRPAMGDVAIAAKRFPGLCNVG